MKIRVIISHGIQGSPSVNWLPWLATELRRAGLEAVVPHYPTPEGQSLESSRATFHRVAEPLCAAPAA